MEIDQWNSQGRAKNERVCAAFEDIIDRGGGSNEDLQADDRPSELADAVLAEVVALNAAGKWREAHDRFDVAHMPFVPHMNKTPQGLTAVAILSRDSLLVRRGSSYQDGPVLHVDGDAISPLDGVVGFAIARNRRWLALATAEGVVVSDGFRGPRAMTIAWPEGAPIRPTSFGISDDAETLVIANDTAGVWLARRGKWTRLAPREGLDDGGAFDVVHGALSPDGRYVAYGWQDAAGHYVEAIAGEGVERVGVISAASDYPYQVLFTDDSKRILSNSRHMLSGVTTCTALESLHGEGENDETTPQVDDYLRAYGVCLLPGELVGQNEIVAWIGGAGWSHAAPLTGGAPAFTQWLGSELNAFDYDPGSKRVAVASGSGVLHVLDPATRSAPGRARGYKPRSELYRWIFWDTLSAPIRW